MTLQRQKELLIATFVALYSVLLFLGFQLFVSRATSWSTPVVIIIAIGSLIWCALMTCATAFVVNRSGSNILTCAIPPILLLILGVFRLDVAIGAIVVFVILIAVQRRLSWELNSRVNVHVIPVFSVATRHVIVALLISLITLSLPTLAQSFDRNQISIPPKTVATLISPFEGVIQNLLPGYTTGSTIDQMIDRQLRNQLSSIPGAEAVVPAELLSSQRATIRQEFSKQFGMPITGQETLADVLANIVNKYLRQMAAENRFVAIGFIIALTLVTVRIAVPVLVWPALFLIRIILRLSEQIGLITILRTQVTVERMSL
jgi:hypothetical protein